MPEVGEAIESVEGSHKHDAFTNRVALTIAVLASFVAVTTIKSRNVDQEMMQAQAETNDNWAWYQAVRVREDMATYELAHLNRLARTTPAPAKAPASVAAGAPLPSTEAQTLANDIKAQEGELAHIRQRKDEVQKLATDAEKKRERFKVRDDQYDLSEALISIAVTLLAVCALAKARWLYWFALLPAAGGLFWGITAMAELPFYAKALFAWLG